MKLLLALAAVLMAVATLHYALHHREREVTQPYREPDDGVQPWDPRCAATGLASP